MVINKKLLQEKTKEKLLTLEGVNDAYIDVLEEMLSSARQGKNFYHYFNDDPVIFYRLRDILKIDGYDISVYDEFVTNKFMVIGW